MTRLILTLLTAFVPLANAGVGDVYYCAEETSDLNIDDPEIKERLSTLAASKWTVKWEKEKVVIRGEEGTRVLPIVFEDGDVFAAVDARWDSLHYLNFNQGLFQRISATNIPLRQAVTIARGRCEKFD
jgi:hypothetical protein